MARVLSTAVHDKKPTPFRMQSPRKHRLLLWLTILLITAQYYNFIRIMLTASQFPGLTQQVQKLLKGSRHESPSALYIHA